MDPKFFIYVITGLILLIALVYVVKSAPKKISYIIIPLLLIIIGFLGFQNYESIMGPVRFEETKEKRYQQVVNQLIKIRQAELAKKEITGTYEDDIDKLAQFIDTAQFVLTVQRDTTVPNRERNIAFGLDPEEGGYYQEKILIDTLGYSSVKDSLFPNTDVSELLEYKFEGASGKIMLETAEKRDYEKDRTYQLFKATALKKDILADQPKKYVRPELEVRAVEKIDGDAITVGNLEEVSTSGNWPRQYASKDEE